MSDRNPENDVLVEDAAQAPVEQPDDDGGAPPPVSGNEAAPEDPGPAQQAEAAEPAQQAEVAEPAQQAGAAEVTEPPDPEGGAPLPGEKAESAVEAQAAAPDEVVEEPDEDGGAPPPAEQVEPEADKVDTGKTESGVDVHDTGGDEVGADRPEGGDADGKIPVLHVFAPSAGDEARPPRALDGRDSPALQDDNLGRNPRDDAIAIRDGQMVPDHRDEGDAAELGQAAHDLGEDGDAPPPDQPLFRGERRPESVADGWKAQIGDFEAAKAAGLADAEVEQHRPKDAVDMRSTSETGLPALMYAEAPPAGPPEPSADGRAMPRPGPSQRLGEPARQGDDVPGFEHGPGDARAHRVEGGDPVPGSEVLVRGDDGRILAVHREGARRDALDEHHLSGDYEMVGLLDTRPGQEFEWGDTGVFRVPTRGAEPGQIEFRPPPPGVYVAWRPVKERPDRR